MYKLNTNYNMEVYDDWVQNGQEVQWIEIDIPIFKGT